MVGVEKVDGGRICCLEGGGRARSWILLVKYASLILAGLRRGLATVHAYFHRLARSKFI